jgi:hypothetical protein
MNTKLLVVLTVCAITFSANECLAQLTREDAKTLIELKQRVEKANDLGRSLFGTDERLVANRGRLGGTVSEKAPREFQFGDWGHSRALFVVLNVISNNEVLVMPSAKGSTPMLIRGINTEKVTDGVEFVLHRPFLISETYQYESVGGGSKTVLVLDTIKVNDRIKEIEEAEEASRVEAEKRLTRTWRMGEPGEFVAKYAGYKKGLVTLIRMEDGSTVEVKISSMSNSDQRWVQREIKRAKEEKALNEGSKLRL